MSQIESVLWLLGVVTTTSIHSTSSRENLDNTLFLINVKKCLRFLAKLGSLFVGFADTVYCKYFNTCISVGNKDTHGLNSKRLADTWMDDYKRLFYMHRRDLRVCLSTCICTLDIIYDILYGVLDLLYDVLCGG